MPSNAFLGVFAKSPIKPIEEHIKIVHQASESLIPFFEHVFKGEWTEADALRVNIRNLEREADSLKREVRLQLPRGLFMPVERTDLLELITHQDKIANKAKDIAGRVVGREMVIPESIQKEFVAYLSRCVDATKQASKAINELDELLETGFRGREVVLVEKMLSELDAIEQDTDDMQIRIRQELRQVEADLNPVDVMFLYKIIEWVGELADIAERVGARLEVMLAR
ncbi:TIGR00153 family protein [Pseudoalteromonas luteoviolacea]|uniref:Phosphate transport regulator n=1 Tax=Pseudoalteromonas luteoviolacea H33 TaxID=1365251 RepID=A0A167F110_9GAMM|nr:TIGR00153 family protein [Pseudoalteromonas luteoviolacea]KZN51462.1 phosphate transport regulator [Pseudoalteromonas luteoviolacea H33]KZN71367.1 phosphate transport regulator [Pseudoalteromonas luteoviolacea H33-S]MBQ4876724.1 TIGR00153 family protein [Pseudoalteromonas luteoviolacea]MBQ4905487.1 TIGR00153 family protein [Pseudoalteromonas luteoviolacea]MCF6438977.1 TIGR00153 family protein [Pseudoalteromonas luteoviolacea]